MERNFSRVGTETCEENGVMNERCKEGVFNLVSLFVFYVMCGGKPIINL